LPATMGGLAAGDTVEGSEQQLAVATARRKFGSHQADGRRNLRRAFKHEQPGRSSSYIRGHFRGRIVVPAADTQLGTVQAVSARCSQTGSPLAQIRTPMRTPSGKGPRQSVL